MAKAKPVLLTAWGDKYPSRKTAENSARQAVLGLVRPGQTVVGSAQIIQTKVEKNNFFEEVYQCRASIKVVK